MVLRRTLIGSALALVAGWQAGHAEAQPKTLKFSHYGTLQDTVHAAAERFKDLVEVGTDGELKVEIHPNNELGNAPTVLQGIRLGTIDIGIVGNPYFTSFEPEMNVLDLPFLFDGPKHAYKVFDGEIGRAILDKLEQHGMKGLALWEIGFRNITNNVRPIRTPADLDGLKIRTTPNPAHIKAFELLGANPTPMNFAELYMALQTGAVDGQENPAHHIYASRFHEVQKHLSMTRHAYTAAPLVMNLQTFNGLPEDQRNVIMEGALEAAKFERKENATLNDNAIVLMRDAGVEVVEDPDVAAFREMIADEVRKDYVDKHGAAMLDQIDALK